MKSQTIAINSCVEIFEKDFRFEINKVIIQQDVNSDWYKDGSHMTCLNIHFVKIPSICDEYLLIKIRQQFLLRTEKQTDGQMD